MAEPTDDPTNRELLEAIAALKEQNAQLVERVASLEGRADNTHNAFIRLAQQVGNLLEQIGMMDLQVIELAEKVFPGYIRTQRQIMEFCNPPKPPKKTDPQQDQTR